MAEAGKCTEMPWAGSLQRFGQAIQAFDVLFCGVEVLGLLPLDENFGFSLFVFLDAQAVGSRRMQKDAEPGLSG